MDTITNEMPNALTLGRLVTEFVKFVHPGQNRRTEVHELVRLDQLLVAVEEVQQRPAALGTFERVVPVKGTIGIRRRRAASASVAYVWSFSRRRSSSRACCHSSAETTGGMLVEFVMSLGWHGRPTRCQARAPMSLSGPRGLSSNEVLRKDVLMSKLVVTEFISVDGVIDSPGGESGYRHAGWTFDIDPDPTIYEFKTWELEQADTQLLGRKTYEGFAAAWPGRAGDGGFADQMNSMEKYVVSTTITSPEWENASVISTDVAARVAELRSRASVGDILVAGSATLVQFLHENELVDEYRLMVFPVVLGSGKRLFPDGATDKVKLGLVESTTYANGIVLNTYSPVR